MRGKRDHEKQRRLRRAATDAERMLWCRLRARGLSGWKFRRQHRVGRYIVDFFCAEKALVVEVDGGQHAKLKNYDERRTRYLESCGVRVLRYWNDRVLGEIAGVLAAILMALERVPGSPHPIPLPVYGERELEAERLT